MPHFYPNQFKIEMLHLQNFHQIDFSPFLIVKVVSSTYYEMVYWSFDYKNLNPMFLLQFISPFTTWLKASPISKKRLWANGQPC